jgi:mutator protein MutT
MLQLNVAIALIWKGNQLLVTRRKSGAHLAGLWEFPGGKLQGVETPELCAEREVREEVGLTVVARARRAVIRHVYADREVTLHPIDCEWLDGDPVLRAVDDARWISPRDLPDLEFPEANVNLIQELAAAEARRIVDWKT